MRSLITRGASGVVYVSVVLLAVFHPPFGVVFLASFFGAAALIEWLQFRRKDALAQPAALLLGIFLLTIYRFSGRFAQNIHENHFGELLIAILFLILFITQAFAQKKRSPTGLFHAIFGLFYIGLPLVLMCKISNLHGIEEPWLLAGTFILIWSTDTFAYLTGRWLGKHKLAPHISPNKTWEGFFGGVVAAVAGGLLLAHFHPTLTLPVGLGLGLVVSLFGSLGDLFESTVKRHFDLKDSGTFMPGHGGILDRIDSLLFAAPMVYFYLQITLR